MNKTDESNSIYALRAGLIAIIAPLALLGFRFSDIPIADERASCVLLTIFWITLSAILAFELKRAATHIANILSQAIFKSQESLYARVLRSHISIFAGSIVLGLLFSLMLLVFVFTVEIYFFIPLFLAALLYSFLHTKLGVYASTHTNEPATAISTTFSVTTVVVLLLAAAHIAFALAMPSTGMAPGTLDVYDHIISTISHSCSAFQHLARTMGFMDFTVRSLREIDEVGGWLFVSTFLALFSIVPFLAFTICTRFFCEAAHRTPSK